MPTSLTALAGAASGLLGAPGLPAIGPLAALTVEVLPSLSAALTITRSVRPTSPAAALNIAVVAPAIAVQLAPSLPHDCH